MHHAVKKKEVTIKRFKICVSGALLAALVGTVPVLSCGNDMNRAQGDFIKAFTICQEALRKRQPRPAQVCIAGMEDRLSIFAGHPDQTALLSDYWYASALASLSMRRRTESKQAFNKSIEFGPNARAEKALADWRQMIKRNQKDLLAEAYQVVTYRINVMRNPRIKDRALSKAKANDIAEEKTHGTKPAHKKISVPDVEARDVIFGEAGMVAEIKAAGYDELDKDMLFMKAASIDFSRFANLYQSKFTTKMLAKLAERSHHYYGLEWRQQKTC